jgi:hypothetical protein
LGYHLEGKYPVVRLVGGEPSDGEVPVVVRSLHPLQQRRPRVLLHPPPNQIQGQLHGRADVISEQVPFEGQGWMKAKCGEGCDDCYCT